MDAAADGSLPYYHYEYPCLTMKDPIVKYEMTSCDGVIISLTCSKEVQYITQQMETSVVDHADPPEIIKQAHYRGDVAEFVTKEAAKRACFDILMDVDGFPRVSRLSPHMLDNLSRVIGSLVHAAVEAKKACEESVVVRVSVEMTLCSRMIHDDRVAQVQLLLRAVAVPKRLSGESAVCPICMQV